MPIKGEEIPTEILIAQHGGTLRNQFSKGKTAVQAHKLLFSEDHKLYKKSHHKPYVQKYPELHKQRDQESAAHKSLSKKVMTNRVTIFN